MIKVELGVGPPITRHTDRVQRWHIELSFVHFRHKEHDETKNMAASQNKFERKTIGGSTVNSPHQSQAERLHHKEFDTTDGKRHRVVGNEPAIQDLILRQHDRDLTKGSGGTVQHTVVQKGVPPVPFGCPTIVKGQGYLVFRGRQVGSGYGYREATQHKGIQQKS